MKRTSARGAFSNFETLPFWRPWEGRLQCKSAIKLSLLRTPFKKCWGIRVRRHHFVGIVRARSSRSKITMNPSPVHGHHGFCNWFRQDRLTLSAGILATTLDLLSVPGPSRPTKPVTDGLWNSQKVKTKHWRGMVQGGNKHVISTWLV